MLTHALEGSCCLGKTKINKLCDHKHNCLTSFQRLRVERLGYPVPSFDFRLAGVMSMSADIHKYGLGAKVCDCMASKRGQCQVYHPNCNLCIQCLINFDQ